MYLLILVWQPEPLTTETTSKHAITSLNNDAIKLENSLATMLNSCEQFECGRRRSKFKNSAKHHPSYAGETGSLMAPCKHSGAKTKPETKCVRVLPPDVHICCRVCRGELCWGHLPHRVRSANTLAARLILNLDKHALVHGNRAGGRNSSVDLCMLLTKTREASGYKKGSSHNSRAKTSTVSSYGEWSSQIEAWIEGLYSWLLNIVMWNIFCYYSSCDFFFPRIMNLPWTGVNFS